MAAAFSCLWSQAGFETIFLSEIEDGKRGVPVGFTPMRNAIPKPKGPKIMFTPLRKIARAVRGKTTQEREFEYLSGSVSNVDLEFRQREIDRGMFRR
jgi:hypothetical protein